MTFRLLPWSLGAALLTGVLACGAIPAPPPPVQQPTRPLEITSGPPSRPSPLSPTSPTPPPTPSLAPPQLAWTVGAHPLPLRPDGFGVVLPTPPALVDRKLPTADLLPPPTSATFESTIRPVPAEVLARSTWK
ncbi:MAG: hypothetical protein ACRDTT_16770, partial [Pseudonocardiaceae bacterium]